MKSICTKSLILLSCVAVVPAVFGANPERDGATVPPAEKVSKAEAAAARAKRLHAKPEPQGNPERNNVRLPNVKVTKEEAAQARAKRLSAKPGPMSNPEHSDATQAQGASASR